MVAPTSPGITRTQAARVERLGRKIFRNCIAADRSLLTSSTTIWTPNNLAELHRRVIDTPHRARGSFAERAEAALADAADPVRQLLAEVIALHDLLLASDTLNHAKKLRTLTDILEPLDPAVQVPAAVDKALVDGPIDAGRGWVNRRWVHLAVVIAFAEHFKTQQPTVRKRAQSDPGLLRQLMLETPADPEPALRHALLYLLRADYFLPVLSPRDRVRLRDALAGEYLTAGPGDDVDADLRTIDDAVRALQGGPADYQQPPWRDRWHPHRDPEPNGEASQDDSDEGAVLAAADRDMVADAVPRAADGPPVAVTKYHPLAPGTFVQSSPFRPPQRPDHNGIDFAADLGTPIYAPADGFFAAVGPAQGFGNWLVLDAQEQFGLDFVFGHMQLRSLVDPGTGKPWTVGDRVRAGQKIAEVGNEGQSTGAHLHFETWSPPGRFGGTPGDPAQTWLPGALDPRQAAADAVAVAAGGVAGAGASPTTVRVGALLVDYSAGVPSAEAIGAAGFAGVVRYVSDPRAPWMAGKPLTRVEADALRARGLAVVSNFQFGKRDWDGGAAQGASDVERGLQLHRDAGGPEDAVLYVSVDADPTEDEWNTKVVPYLRAWQDRISKERMGLYCNAPCIDRAKRDGLGTYFWQHNWGSHGRVHPDAHLHQFEIDDHVVDGVTVDRNRVLQADFGQWDHAAAGALRDPFPLPPNFYWGPLEGPDESWSNKAGTEPQYSFDGLKRWQATLGLPESSVFDDTTRAAAAAIQRAKGWAPTGTIGAPEWDAVIREGWRPAPGQKWPPAPELSTKDGYAQAIIAEGVRRGITPRGIKIALATALVESELRMYANSNDRASMLLPHDAVGSDHMSVGLFQQQNFAEWKSLECRMDAGCSAGTFYEHLNAFDYNSEARSPGRWADAVQRSQFPDRYDHRIGDATALYDKLIGTVDADADAGAVPLDADRWPLPPGVFWGPLEGPDQSWSNRNGTEPQYSRDGLRRWQQSVGIAATAIYDDATRAAALQLQQQFGLPQTGTITEAEWGKAIREGWHIQPIQPAPQGAEPPEQGREVKLPYDESVVPQQTHWWCGPASCQVVLNGQGIIRAEEDIARQVEEFEHPGRPDDEDGTDFIGLLERYLDSVVPEARYTTVEMPDDPPTVQQKAKLWADLRRSIDAGRGVVMNWVSPPSNKPRGIKGSPNPSYPPGTTTKHYVSAMGYDSSHPGGAVWIADSGFQPRGYWVSLDQCASLIPPKGYCFSDVAPIAPPAPPIPPPVVVAPPAPAPQHAMAAHAAVRAPDGYPITRVTGPGFNHGHGEYLRIYLHTTENQDWVGTAEGVASYQESVKHIPKKRGSYHYIVDDTHIISTVATTDTAWATLSDNDVSVHIAMVGTSGEIERWQGENPNKESNPKRPEQWLAHDKMLDMVAYTIAIVARDHSIPIERVTTEGVGLNRRGVSSHNNYTYGSKQLKGFKDGDHWDVPDTFPFDVVLAAAKGYEALVNDADRFPLPPGIFWGPLEGPDASWSNRNGTEPQASIDGLRRWQLAIGVPGTGIYDDATRAAALQLQQTQGWEPTGNIDGNDWDEVIRRQWSLAGQLPVQPGVPAEPAPLPPLTPVVIDAAQPAVVQPVLVAPAVVPPIAVPQAVAAVKSPGGYPITWVGGPGYTQGHHEYLRIYLHTTENQDWITTAENVAAYQTRTKNDPKLQGSYHFLVDDTHIVHTVATKNTAWGVLSDNAFSVQIAMVGTSGEIEAWNGENPNREERPKRPEQWLAHDTMLDMVAYTIAIVARDHDIPIERVDIDGVGANRRGVSSHHNYTYGSSQLKGFKDGTHWDVPNTFPYDLVLAAAKGYASLVNDPDRFPLPPGHYWGPFEGPTESWSNMFGGEPQSSKDGLTRWQRSVGIAGSGIYDAATRDTALTLQRAQGLPADGGVHEVEWNEVIKRGWRLPTAAPQLVPTPIDPGPPVACAKKVKDATGPGLTDQFGMAATDLGVMTRTPSGRILAVFGDTFRGPRVGDGDWRAPVALFSDTTRLDDGIVWHEAAGGVPNYAAQLWAYPHDNPLFSTVLPSDVITVGDTIYLHVMVNKVLGNVVWTEIWRSTDDGHTWQHTGAKFDPGLHNGLAQMWTWDLCEDGWVYVLSTGFQRDKPLILRRVAPDKIADPTAYQSWAITAGVGSWGATATPVLQGVGADDKFGELCLRRIQNQWVLVNFDASTSGGHDIDVRVFPDITGDLNAAHKSTPIRGVGWGQEADDAVAQLYGPCIIPGSRLDGGFHILLSQYKTAEPDKGWPYRAMQFKIPVTTTAGFQDDGAVNPHGGR